MSVSFDTLVTFCLRRFSKRGPRFSRKVFRRGPEWLSRMIFRRVLYVFLGAFSSFCFLERYLGSIFSDVCLERFLGGFLVASSRSVFSDITWVIVWSLSAVRDRNLMPGDLHEVTADCNRDWYSEIVVWLFWNPSALRGANMSLQGPPSDPCGFELG